MINQIIKGQTCPFCGQKIEQQTIKIGNRLIYLPLICHCQQAEKHRATERQKKEAAEAVAEEAKKIARIKQEIRSIDAFCFNFPRFQARNFDNFIADTSAKEKNRQICVKYAANIAKLPPSPVRNSLYLVGNCGTGKTHLAAAIYNALSAKPCIFNTMQNILNSLQQGVLTDYQKQLAVLEKCHLLFLDDLGKEKTTEWAVSTIYQVINGRYNSCRPIVITSNYTPQELQAKWAKQGDMAIAEAIIDRLQEMCCLIPFSGDSFRKKK